MSLPADVTSGQFKQLSFPALLWKLSVANVTGVLEIKKGDVEKRVFFEEGQPVHAESNLLHETLGKYLVEEKVITPAQEQAAMLRTMEGKQTFTDALVQSKAIDAAKLYESVRKSFALKILDCLTWDMGDFSFQEGASHLENIVPLKMNPARLIMRGVETILPLSRLEAEGFSDGSKKFRVNSKSGVNPESLQLSAEDVRLLKEMKKARSMAELAKAADLDLEAVSRKLYALSIFGMAEEARDASAPTLDELVSSALLHALRPAPPEVPVEKTDLETQALATEIATDHMKLMSLNYFELLAVPETATAVEIRDKFMEFAVRYSPSRFRSRTLGEFKDRGEEIFLRGVKAFAALSDFDSKTKYLDKIKAERAKNEGGKKKGAGESFKIQTTLLDADSQFQKGLKYLRDKKYDKALEFFQYAADIDGMKPAYLAHLGWATYQLSPERNRKQAEEIIRRSRDLKPESEDAAYFLGKLLLATERRDEAMPHLKRAAELAPKNIEMVRELRNAERPAKK